jgi:GDP/UDP-N,N'-diacetylbacillosamine 2-epimerase (hydrolysing)
LQSLLNVLDKLNDTYIIFTEPNADTDNRIIKRMINKFVLSHEKNSISFSSMGRLNYLSTLQFVDGVIGNSSSGLTEAPTFKIGTINIGDRQKGRLKADSIIDCSSTEESIFYALSTLYSSQFQNNLKNINNPYGVGNTTEKIISVLKDGKIPKNLKKKFYNL